MSRRHPASPGRWRPFALVVLIGSLLLLPGLLLSALARPPAGVLWWAAHALLGCALIGTLLFEFDDGRSPRLAALLPRVWLATLGVGAGLTVMAPEQVLGWWLESDGEYAVARLLAAVVAVGAGVLLTRQARAYLRPARRERTPQEGLASKGRIPGGGSGRAGSRRRRRAAELEASGTYVGRLAEAVTHRAALLARYAGLGTLTMVAWLGFAAATGGAFTEGWAALMLAWVLMFETRVVRWRHETLADGFVEDDLVAGRAVYEQWWGLAAGWVIALTASVSGRMGGLRPEPWLVYAVLAFAGWLISTQAWRRISRDPDAVLTAWLRRRPERRAELERLRDDWPRSRGEEFGVLPEPGDYAGPKTGERPRGR
ncbi:MAG: hypothetical protein ACLGHZ_03325 [Actinomycetes bacterium]